MALRFECEWCGGEIYRGQDYVRFSAQEKGLGLDKDSLDRLGLTTLDCRIQNSFHFHLSCFEASVRLLDDHRDWAGQSAEAWRKDDLPRWQLDERRPASVPFRPGVDGTSLNALALAARVQNRLSLAGISSVEELEALSVAELREVEGLGPKGLADILRALARSEGAGTSAPTG